MKNIANLIYLLLLSVGLSACSYIYGDDGVIKNRDTDYLKAQSIAPMQTPPGYNTSSIESNYPVSSKHYPTSTQSINLSPPDLSPAVANTAGK